MSITQPRLRLLHPFLPGLLEPEAAFRNPAPASSSHGMRLVSRRAGPDERVAPIQQPSGKIPDSRVVSQLPGTRSMVPEIAPRDTRLAGLRLTLERLEKAGRPEGHVLSLGDLDPHLPGGGLACGVLHEVTADYADRPAAFGFIFALAAIAQVTRLGPVFFIAPRRTLQDFGRPYAHGLVQQGLDPGRLVLVETRNDRDALWALEEALRTPGLAAVCGTVTGNLDLTAARRLNLAAGTTATPLALLRLGLEATGPAATRWRIASAPAARDPFGAFAASRWSAALERCRNGRPAHWLIEWKHDTHRFCLVASLADRAPLAQPDAAAHRQHRRT